MKEKGVLSRLFGYMGRFRITMALSFVFAALSAVVNLSAYVCVYQGARELVRSMGDFSRLDRALLIEQGWRAVFLVSMAFMLYGVALMFSHITAFNTVAKLRIKLIRHIGSLPLGYHTGSPSGKQRKIIEKNTDSLEAIIAHKLRSIVECDQIVVLNEGRLVESGTHDELMKREGLYHHLYAVQSENMRWTV